VEALNPDPTLPLSFESVLRDQYRGRNAEGRFAAKRVVAVISNAGRVEEPLTDARLELDHPRIVGDLRVGGADLVALMLASQGQNLPRHQLDVALPIDFDAITVEETRFGTRRVRIEITLIEFRVGEPQGLIEDAVERH